MFGKSAFVAGRMRTSDCVVMFVSLCFSVCFLVVTGGNRWKKLVSALLPDEHAGEAGIAVFVYHFESECGF